MLRIGTAALKILNPDMGYAVERFALTPRFREGRL